MPISFLRKDNSNSNIFVKIIKLIALFVLSAVGLGFFAAFGIWAAVRFLELFGIETL